MISVVAAAQEAARRTIRRLISYSRRKKEQGEDSSICSWIRLILTGIVACQGGARVPVDPGLPVMAEFLIEAPRPGSRPVRVLESKLSRRSTVTSASRSRRMYVAARPCASEGGGLRVRGSRLLYARGRWDPPVETCRAAIAREQLLRYPSVPRGPAGTTRRDQAYQGRKLGSALLWDAVERSLDRDRRRSHSSSMQRTIRRSVYDTTASCRSVYQGRTSSSSLRKTQSVYVSADVLSACGTDRPPIVEGGAFDGVVESMP